MLLPLNSLHSSASVRPGEKGAPVSCGRVLPGSFLSLCGLKNMNWQRQGAPESQFPRRLRPAQTQSPVSRTWLAAILLRGNLRNASVRFLCVGTGVSWCCRVWGSSVSRTTQRPAGPVPARHQATQSVCQGFLTQRAAQTKPCQGRLPGPCLSPQTLGGDEIRDRS